MKKITILVPVYNEENSIIHFFERTDKVFKSIEKNNPKKYQFDYLFINDGSNDNTLEILKRESKTNDKIKFIDLSRNFGKEIAMSAGIDYLQCDATVIIDADLQDPPELIEEMLKYYEDGYNDVYAKRTSRKGESFLKKWTSKKYYSLLAKHSDFPIQKDTGDFRLLDSKCIAALKELKESNRNMKSLFSWIGYKKKEVLFEREARHAGSTKFNYPKLFKLALDGITASTSMPLKISTFIGSLISLFSFIFIMIIIARTFILGRDTPGYASLFSAICFFGGIQLISIGILGEYIGRIFSESKERPLYYVQETNF